MSLHAAMKLVESRQYAEAETALVRHADSSADGVIARFRRAECLSRLGRHEEAVAEARQACQDDPHHPPASLWLAQALAEAGRYAEAAEVEVPGLLPGEDRLLRDGFLGLAELADDRRGDPEGTVGRILESRHAPILSLGLRLSEQRRMSANDRLPDVVGAYLLFEAFLNAEDEGHRPHADVPYRKEASGPLAGDGGAHRRFVRLLLLDDGLATARKLIPRFGRRPDSDAERDFEEHLRDGNLDAAEALLDGLAAETDADELSGEYAIHRVRLELLRGRPADVADQPGGDEACRRLDSYVASLRVARAALEGHVNSARDDADHISRPMAPEFVQSSLMHWVLHPPTDDDA